MSASDRIPETVSLQNHDGARSLAPADKEQFFLKVDRVCFDLAAHLHELLIAKYCPAFSL